MLSKNLVYLLLLSFAASSSLATSIEVDEQRVLADGHSPHHRRPCGFKIAPCPSGQTCSHISPTCTRGQNCAGLCARTTKTTSTSSIKPSPTKTYQDCGGHRITPAPCPTGQLCVDDPAKKGCGLACDQPGICVKQCGGFAGLRCPTDMKCVDRPGDDCDPKNGGADCIGICVWK